MNATKPPQLDFATPKAAMDKLALGMDWQEMGEADHFVQFYENEVFLTRSVSSFIAAGLENGNSAILIATTEHREGIEKALTQEGHDLAQLELKGDYFALDAANALATFMVDGLPDRELFNQTIGEMVERATCGGRKLRAFGEMVALLWADKNDDAAIQLEEFWNELINRRPFSLFCAYPWDGCRGESRDNPLIQVCQAHTHVIPAESYAAKSNSKERLHAIMLLQQKASSLAGMPNPACGPSK
jgi:hypothetical protein